jgi:hypothetical protein
MANAAQVAKVDSTKKKQVIRSPKYPLITITDALAKAKVIYQYEKKAKTTAAVVLGHLGYKNATGLAARVLSALQQYGLLDKSDSQYRISEQAFKIFNLTEDDPERARLMREAALKPALFKELLSKYPDDLPSDATLKSYLVIHKDFNENSVESFFKVFKGAIDLAKPYTEGYTSAELHGDQDPPEVQDIQTPSLNRLGQKQPPPPVIPVGHKDFPLYLSQSQKAVLYIPASISRKDYELLKKQIEHSLSIIEATSLLSEDDKPEEV